MQAIITLAALAALAALAWSPATPAFSLENHICEVDQGGRIHVGLFQDSADLGILLSKHMGVTWWVMGNGFGSARS